MEDVRTGRGANLVAAVLLVAVGVTVFAQTTELARLDSGSDPGAAGYPRLLAGLLVVLAVGVGMQRGGGEPAPSAVGGLRVGGAVVLLLGYGYALDALGYIGSTVLFLAGAMLLMGVRRPVPLVVAPVLFSVVVYLVFQAVFGVPLPRGAVEGLLP